MHPSTMEYVKPTETQQELMASMRVHAKNYMEAVQQWVPEGPDKTYVLRKLREVTMWVNVAITRLPDGTPRT